MAARAAAAPSQDTELEELNAAAARGDHLAVLALEDGDAALESCDAQGKTPLMRAAALGYGPAVRALLALGAKEVAMDPQGESALHAAVRGWQEARAAEYSAVFSALLAADADLHAPNCTGQSPLDLAEREAALLAALLLAQQTEGLGAQLRRAAASGSLEGWEPLLGQQPGVTASTDRYGNTALHLAADCANAAAVEALAAAGAALDARNFSGATPLILAASEAKEGCSQVAQLLVEAGADATVVDGKGWSAAHYAAMRGQAGLLRVLLGAAQVPPDASTPDSKTSLHIAAQLGHSKCLGVLLRHGAEVDARMGSTGSTALQLAAEAGHSVLVRALVRAGADVAASDADGDTALTCAVRGWQGKEWSREYFGVVVALAAAGANPEAASGEGETPCSLAGANPRLLQRFRQALSEAKHTEGGAGQGKELRSAAAAGNLAAVQRLLRAEPGAVDRPGRDGSTAMHAAAAEGHLAVLQTLVRGGGANVNLANSAGTTPLMAAAAAGYTRSVEFLLLAGADVAAANAQGSTAVHLAAAGGHLRVLAALLAEEGASCGVTDQLGDTPLHLAARAGDQAAVALLLSHGASANARNAKFQAPLHGAARGGHVRAAEALLRAHADASATDEASDTALHCVAKFWERRRSADYCSLAKLLLEAGANPCLANLRGQTPLWLAGARRFNKLQQLMLQHLEEEDLSRHQAAEEGEEGNGSGVDPELGAHLRAAAAAGDADTVAMLLDFYEGPELADSADRRKRVTAMHLAAANGHAHVLQQLLGAGAEVDARTARGATPLMEAAGRGRHAAVELLLAAGADVGAQDQEEWTAQHWAASRGRSAALNLLLEHLRGEEGHTAAVNRPAQDGRTALHLASAAGHIQCVRALLAAGADTCCLSDKRRTPLMLAAARGHGAAVRELLQGAQDAAAYASLQDARGLSALHMAAYVGSGPGVRALLGAGACPQAAAGDDAGSFPLHSLVAGWEARRARQSLGAARSLLNAGALPAAQHKLGESAASLAAARGIAPLQRLFGSWLASLRSSSSSLSLTMSGGVGRPGSQGSAELEQVRATVVDCSDVVKLKEIGTGSYGKVYLAKWQEALVAVKELRIDFASDLAGENLSISNPVLAELQKEAGLMSRLRHPNIVSYIGVSTRPPCVLTEFCENGSLRDVLNEAQRHPERPPALLLTWHRRLSMMLDCAKGMLHLHARNPAILHRDLKSPNLLVDRNWRVKVADFNLSKILSPGTPDADSIPHMLNPRWLAPEVAAGRSPHTRHSDVYSFGIVLWECLTWSTPFSGRQTMELLYSVANGERPEMPDLSALPGPNSSSFAGLEAYVQLMLECWDPVPEERPPFHEIIDRLRNVLSTYIPAALPRGGQQAGAAAVNSPRAGPMSPRLGGNAPAAAPAAAQPPVTPEPGGLRPAAPA